MCVTESCLQFYLNIINLRISNRLNKTGCFPIDSQSGTERQIFVSLAGVLFCTRKCAWQKGKCDVLNG